MIQTHDNVRKTLDEIYHASSRQILATLIRLLGDFDLAEDAMQEAFTIATSQWPTEGIPANPLSWLISTGRFKAIDTLRRKARFKAALPELAEKQLLNQPEDPATTLDNEIEDDQLRLIFTCCHYALSEEARVALTLKIVCDLSTEEIARAFLSTTTTIAQRIVRAKSKIRAAGIPYQIPSPDQLPERLDSVLQVIYLVFNEGYSSTTGESLTRPDLSGEAIRLGRLLLALLPNPEVMGLLGLMLLQESRREARTSLSGDLILLEDQDRCRWNHDYIQEGTSLIVRSLVTQRFGPYTVQGAIAAVHAEALKAADTDWAQIVALYAVLLQMTPSPVIELNQAVAIAMLEGPAAGLSRIEAILGRGDLLEYYLAYSAKAELFRRLGNQQEAKIAYQKALSLTQQGPERRFLESRLKKLT